jgi:hypothetical protein
MWWIWNSEGPASDQEYAEAYIVRGVSRPAREFLYQLDSTPEAKTLEVLDRKEEPSNIWTREAVQWVYCKQATSRSARRGRREAFEVRTCDKKERLKQNFRRV